MKKRWIKRILAMGAAVMMLTGSLTVLAAPTALATAPVEMEAEYFKNLKGQGDTALPGNPSLTISKYKYSADGQTADENQPIGGVKFQYARVGNIYQVGNEMVYGIHTDVADAAGIADRADFTYTFDDGTNTTPMSFYKDYTVISTGVQASQSSAYVSTQAPLTTTQLTKAETKKDGQITGVGSSYGLYLIIESDVSGAYQGEETNKIAISKTQNPFIAAVPYFVEGTGGQGGYWVETVNAKVKNSTGEAEVEKKIIEQTEYDANNGTEVGADTDTADIGDTVYFHLKSTVPAIPTGGEDLSVYTLTDNISKGLTFNSGSVKVYTLVEGGTVQEVTSGYDVSPLTLIGDPAPAGTPKEYAGGNSFTITFDADGCKTLSELSKNNQGKKIEVIVYCSATVNENAVIGPQGTGNQNNSGNPNRVKLEYKIGQNGQPMTTPWDVVTEFTFGIDVTKVLGDGTAITAGNRNNIQFVLYQNVNSAEKYYTFAVPAAEGTYVVKTGEPSADTEELATKMSPSAGGKLYVKGLDEGTYYLKEVATEAGYNLLEEPIEIKLEGKKGKNDFVDAIHSANDYLGTLTATDAAGVADTNGYQEFNITNTKGFRLPATGGAGTAMFALIGVLIIAAGGGFYYLTSKKRK